MRILLLDNNVRNRRAGKQQLEAKGHTVVTLSAYVETRELAERERFDVALIDLLMPAERMTLGQDALITHLGREIGVGFPMAIILAASGISKIAVATDSNHHAHPMSAIVDWFGHERPITINGAYVLFLHSPMSANRMKDWVKVLDLLCA